MAAAKRSERRVRITVSIAPSLLRWIEGQVGMGKRYRSVAQAVEDAVVFYKDHQPANR
jgi:Arc/MetJ-type ribon-helix-helix transcriptional regulator